MPHNKLDKGWRRIRLTQQLALGAHTPTELANQHGVVPSSIKGFAARWDQEIQAAKAELDAQYASLWIADKLSRLAEYEADIENINDNTDNEPDAALLAAKHRALKQAAEELGQLTTKAEITHEIVAYQITTVDPGQLT